MRTPVRFAFFGIALLIVALVAWEGSRTMAQNTGAAAPQRFATCDLYAIMEKMLLGPDVKKAQDDLKFKWDPKIEGVQNDLRKLEADLQVLPQSDPKYDAIMKTGREKQADYERFLQERQSEYEALSAKQIVDAYTTVRDAASRFADKQGYSHVFASRPPDRAIASQTLGNALQEFLARPLVKFPAGDDITRAVADELKVDISAPAPTAPASPSKP
jgi:Skp family chaperone for outer membrane proteins